jgi:hypothetical protein
MYFEAHTRRKMCSCDKFWSLQVHGSLQPDTVCYSAHSVQGKSAHTSWYSLLQCLFCTELFSMHIIVSLLQCTFCTALVSTHIVIQLVAMYMEAHTSTKCNFITLCDNLTLSLLFKILSVISVFCSLPFLGMFTKLWKVTVNLRHVCLSVHMEQLGSTEWIFIKFDIWVYFEKLSRKIQVLLKSDMSKGYPTRRPVYIFFI